MLFLYYLTAFVAVFLVCAALYFLCLQLFRVPRLSFASRAVRHFSRFHAKKSALAELIAIAAAGIASRTSISNSYMKRQAKLLKIAGIKTTPEMFFWDRILTGALLFTAATPLYFLAPATMPLMLLLTVLFVMNELGKPGRMLKEHRAAVEAELPRLANNFAIQLRSSRDIVELMSANAQEFSALSEELSYTAADIKSSSLEAALNRLDARINSTMMSEFVRGLISVSHGDSKAEYFAIMARNFKEADVQRLKKTAGTRPAKINICGYALMIVLVLNIIYMLGSDLLSSTSVLFS